MRAVRIVAWGSPPEVTEVADPPPAPGRTLVAVEAATVGHVDRSIWSGSFARLPPLPYTPGVEGAGIVVASDAFAPGSRVWVRGGGLGIAADGTWSELVSAPDAAVGSLPDGVDFLTGSAFFSPCTSAWVSLVEIARVQAGETVLVTGAAGAVGSVTVQLALDAGADVVGAVSSPERAELLPAGVEPLVLSGPLDRAAADVVVDTVGGEVLERLLPHVNPRCRVVLVGYLAGGTVSLDLPGLVQRDVSLLPLNMIHREPAGRAAAPHLLELLAAGRLRVEVTPFDLDDAGRALEWLVEPGHRGRAVLTTGAGP